MVGMAIAAVPVVADDDVGVLLVENVGETTSRFVEGCSLEDAVGVVLCPAGHS